MTDLLELTADLVRIPSVSHHEGGIADRLESELRDVPWLEVERVGDNVVARTHLGRRQRLILAGHLDTVPPNGNADPVVDGDVLMGLGACDMKAGIAVFLELARTVAEPAIDVSYLFYVCEEVEGEFNGLNHLAHHRPELLAGDAAILGEPTGSVIEAGCQGSMRLDVSMAGRRAHTARPWMGVNAVHRLGPVLARTAGFPAREPVLDGCTYREALQAVGVQGGVAGNVVPDRAVLTLNHRFAPDRSPEQAEAQLRAWLRPVVSEEEGDQVTVVDVAAGAPPNLRHPLLRSLITKNDLEVRAKLGWTDVARFAAMGLPACNFGPGDPVLAHTAEEQVERGSIETVHSILRGLLEEGPTE